MSLDTREAVADKAGSVRKSASVDSPAPKRRKLEAEDEDVDEEQEVAVILDQLDTPIHHHSCNFMLNGELWNLLVAKSDPAPANLWRTVCMNAVHLGGSKHFPWQRKGVQFSVTLLNQTGGPHLMRSETFSFSAQTPRMPFVSWLNLEELRKPDSEFNADGKLLFRVGIKIKMPLPAQSLRGDVELALDTGENIRVHSLLLELASPVLSDALKVARDAHTAPDPCEPVRLPMPSVSVKEARMLLQALYSAQPETTLQAQSMQSLKDLAHVSHRYACMDQFRLADACLVGKCGAQSHLGSLSARVKSSLSTVNALYWYRWAKELGLERFEAEVAWFIGAHFHELQFDEVAEGSLAHMLQRATSVLPSRQETAFVKAQLEKLRALATQPQSQQTSQEMVKAANAALSRLNRLKPE